MLIPLWLQHAIETYGYWVVLIAVALESMGIPFPGETALVAGGVYAGTTGRVEIVGVIAAAAAGAIIGDNIGFAIGRYGGYPLITRLAHLLHVNPQRLAYVQESFNRHGDKLVFFGRFFSILRTYVALFAGINRMPWRSFLIWNALGGITWAIIFGVLGFVLGRNTHLLGIVLGIIGTGGIVLLVAIIVALVVWWIVRRRRRERQLESSADLSHLYAQGESEREPEAGEVHDGV